MIDLQNICNEEPYLEFKRFYDLAKDQNQNSIQAICISSFNNKTNQPNPRFVNLKLVKMLIHAQIMMENLQKIE